jgi:hypothetical protein
MESYARLGRNTILTESEFEELDAVLAKVNALPGAGTMFSALMYVQRGKRPFVTIGKRFGFVSGDVREGDRICVFDGTFVPYVVRKCSDGDGPYAGAFRLVGEAYVYGIMDGEVDALDIVSQELTLV